MEEYIGTKIVKAEPAWRVTGPTGYTFIKLVSPEAPCEEGSIFEEGYKVFYPDGYESWSPKYTFEAAYRLTTGMNFGLAVEAARLGNYIRRPSWNGKGMFVVFQKGYPQGIPCNKQTAQAWGMAEGDLFICNPYLQIQQVNGSHSMWVPSINDVLADDWEIC